MTVAMLYKDDFSVQLLGKKENKTVYLMKFLLNTLKLLLLAHVIINPAFSNSFCFQWTPVLQQPNWMWKQHDFDCKKLRNLSFFQLLGPKMVSFLFMMCWWMELAIMIRLSPKLIFSHLSIGLHCHWRVD